MIVYEGDPGPGAAKFKFRESQDGWDVLEIDDGYKMSVKATGWLYRASAYNTGWKIIGGKLYNHYWDGPVGVAWRGGVSGGSAPDRYSMGMDLTEVTNCVWVPAT
jgi:hypothetical protein